MKRAVVLLLGLAVLGVIPSGASSDGRKAAPKDSHPARGCQGPAAFVGIVYDSALRDDFRIDVGNFERYADKLSKVYCMPETRQTVLAMRGGWKRKGKVYADGSKANFFAALKKTGAWARKHPGAPVFIALSSHGMTYAVGGGCAGPGSYSALADGLMYDCELGAALNDSFTPKTPLVVMIDCSFCGGFSDSPTAVSGTLRDDPTPAGIVGPDRIVITGCAITTECFGSDRGGVLYKHLNKTLDVERCDGFTAPGFPEFQGADVPVRLLSQDGKCTVSEWFFAAVDSVYQTRDYIGIQEQFRIKYGFDTLDEDIRVR